MMAWAQGHLTDAQRDEQIRFIKQDTLPVSIEALPCEVNTRFSEYSPVLISDSFLLFTSMRADVEEDYDRLFETSWCCFLYQSKRFPDGDHLPAEALPEIINKRNVFNSNFCYNPDTKELIFSRCSQIGNGELHCSLWSSKQHDKGWHSPKKLPNVINTEGTSNMQPFLVALPEYDVLYFVSNRKNGIGGLDIWYSIRKDGKFDTPINAGSIINTEGNEITPFYDKENKTVVQKTKASKVLKTEGDNQDSDNKDFIPPIIILPKCADKKQHINNNCRKTDIMDIAAAYQKLFSLYQADSKLLIKYTLYTYYTTFQRISQHFRQYILTFSTVLIYNYISDPNFIDNQI